MIDQMEAFVLEARIKVIVAPRQWGKTTILRLEADYAPDEKTLCVLPSYAEQRDFSKIVKQRRNLIVTNGFDDNSWVGLKVDLVLVDNFEYNPITFDEILVLLPKRVVLTSSEPLPFFRNMARIHPDYLYLSYL